MSYTQKAKSYVSNTVRAAALVAGGIALAVLAGGCKSTPSELELKAEAYRTARQTEKTTYEGKGISERIKHITEKLAEAKKDGAINPATKMYELDEIITVYEQKARLENERKTLKGTDDESKAQLAKIDEQLNLANQYITELANSDRVTGYVILKIQEAPGMLPVISGLISNNHLQLQGTLATHAQNLGFSIEEALKKNQSVYGEGFGCTPGPVRSERNKQQIRESSVDVPRENWKNLAQFFPEVKDCDTAIGNELRNKAGERITAASFDDMLATGKIIGVRVAYVAKPAETQAKTEAPAEVKPAELAENK